MTEADMRGYSDYRMNLEDGRSVAGVCHPRGMNANLSARWLIYIVIHDLEKSLADAGCWVETLSMDHGHWERMAGPALSITQLVGGCSVGATHSLFLKPQPSSKTGHGEGMAKKGEG